MADNWNEQELQTLFRKHLPIKQMSPDFADQLKKQILAEVAATLGPNPVASVATEETNTNLVAPVRERALPVKVPHSVAAPKAAAPKVYSWMDWLRDRLRLTPSLTMAGAVGLAIWAFLLWGNVVIENIGELGQTQTVSGGNGAEVLSEEPVQNNPGIAGVVITPTATTASAVAMVPTVAAEEATSTLTSEATPQPAAVQTNADEAETPDTLVVTSIATRETSASGWNEDVDLAPIATDTVTPGATQNEASATPNSTNGVIASPTPINTVASTGSSVLVPTPISGGLPTAMGTRPTVVVVTPTNLANPERNGTVTPTPVGTRRPAGTPSATPLTLTLGDMATIVATRGIGNNGPNPTLTPFEPTSTSVPSVLIPTPTPTNTRSLFPWKSPTPRPTNTNTPLPVDTDTPVSTATRVFQPTPTEVEPTLTDSPLPTVLVTNTPLPEPTDTPPPTVTAVNTRVATSTSVAPASTSTSAPTSTPVPPTATLPPAPTNTPVPPTATLVPTWTNTPVPPTATLPPAPTNTPVPPPTATATPLPTFTDTPVPPPTATVTPLPTFTDTPVPPPTATATAVNMPPTVVLIPIQLAVAGQEYSYPVAVVDLDTPVTELQFSVIEPSWLRFEPPTILGAKLYGTPPGAGDYNVKIQVWDGVNTPVPHEFKITVMASLLDDLFPTDNSPGGQGDANPNPSGDVQASNSVTETQTMSDTTPAN